MEQLKESSQKLQQVLQEESVSLQNKLVNCQSSCFHTVVTLFGRRAEPPSHSNTASTPRSYSLSPPTSKYLSNLTDIFKILG